MNIEYNTQRPTLSITEYGRNVQKMIQEAIIIEDREKRNRMAQIIVRTMAQLTTQSKEAGDFWQKIWDHLFILSEFKLDVDSPFPKPEENTTKLKPTKVSYPVNTLKYRYYGKNIQDIIKKATSLEEGEKRQALVKQVANQMKKSYLTWNRDSVTDNIIISHLSDISGNVLTLDDSEKLNKTSDILAATQKKPKYQKQGRYPKNKRSNFRKQNGN